MSDRDRVARLLVHPHLTAAIREQLAAAATWLESHPDVGAAWAKRLDTYETALELATERAGRGETPFVDVPRARRPFARKHTREASAPAWASDRSLLPMRPPERRACVRDDSPAACTCRDLAPEETLYEREAP